MGRGLASRGGMGYAPVVAAPRQTIYLAREKGACHVIQFTRADYSARQERVRAVLRQRGQDGMLFFDSFSVLYLSGFAFIPTERPMALVLTRESSALLVPFLEQKHAEQDAAVDQVRSYPEYPDLEHPMRHLGRLLRELGLDGKPLLADRLGYGGWGYRGPSLPEVLPEAKWTADPDVVELMRRVKEPKEVEAIRESARWGNLAHRLLQDYSRPGATELEVSMRASQEATWAMLKTLGPDFKPGTGSGASAGFRGQIGPNSALPHATTVNATLRPGDTLVTGAGSRVWEYNSELERTMFVGEPNQEQRQFFRHMLNLQEAALEAIRPGRPVADVDKAVRAYFEKEDLWRYWHHHSGHGIGLNYHEPPFFDQGETTVLEPAMVFSVEPGLYVEGLGGFRHSDTVVVTETGYEFLTYYPRQLTDLICG